MIALNTSPGTAVELLTLEQDTQAVLLLLGGKPKPQLVRAAHTLKQDFARYRSQQRTPPSDHLTRSEFVYFYNSASLLLYHRGDIDGADGLCRRVITLCTELGGKIGRDCWRPEALQPFINRARIAGIRGDSGYSVGILKDVFLVAMGAASFDRDGCHISPELLTSNDNGTPPLRQVGRHVYISDSVRAYLQADDTNGLLQFLNGLAADVHFPACEANPYLLLEARARALARLGRYADALEVMKEFVQRMRREGRHFPAIYTTLASFYVWSDQPSEATRVTKFCEDYTVRAYEHQPASLDKFQSLFLLACAQCRIKDFSSAYRNARAAYAIALDIGMEPCILRALTLLIDLGQLSKDADALCWFDELRTLVGRSYYTFEQAIALCALGSVLDSGYLCKGVELLGALETISAKRILHYLRSHCGITLESFAGDYDGKATRNHIDALDETVEMLLRLSPSDLSLS